MKNTALVLVLLLAACAVPPGAHDAGEQGGDTTVFIEDHHQKKDVAFLAAAGWFSEHSKGGKDALQLSDKGSGTMIAKGACRWSKPVDSFQLHFHEGWAEYSLKVKISVNKVEMVFQTGEVYGDGEHGPKDLMPQILPCFKDIKNGIMKAISGKGE